MVQHSRRLGGNGSLIISIIVPVLDEEAALPRLLENLRLLEPAEGTQVQLVFVDGGSTDETRAILRQAHDLQMIDGPRGRGAQIRAGAEAACGDLLLIVHADAQLPPKALRLISDAARDEAPWGWFNLAYDDDSPSMRLISRYLNLHALLLSEPTGENAIWATREAWEAAGGCPELPLMEDLELARRLRRGGRGARLPGPVVCSARRYRAWTPVGMSLRCMLLWLLFHVGAPPETLRHFYPRVR